ncbi:MAG TPA: hypothetical protein VIX20_01815 [Ktedonobacteraceae bacterium]
MSESETLSQEYAAKLLRCQDALQAEARAVLEDLGIVRLLSQLGNPVQLGSSALGLMVWPDIDMTVSCPGLTIERALETMRPVYAHPMVKRVRYLNEVGHFNPSGLELHDRYYFGVYFHATSEIEWKIDISFWLGVEEHSEPVHNAVLEHGVRTPGEFDVYLAERGKPAR